MTIPPLTPAQKLLCQKAAELCATLSPAWTSFYNASERRTEIFVEGEAGEDAAPILLATEHLAWADREFVVRGPQMLQAVMAEAQRRRMVIAALEAELRQLKGEPEPGREKKSVAQWCGRVCTSPAFKRWLHEIHQADISDQKRVDSRVRSMLGIESRAELDTDPAAAARWRAMAAEFEAWRKQ